MILKKIPSYPGLKGSGVYATGTTLGADNGMGRAAAMAVLKRMICSMVRWSVDNYRRGNRNDSGARGLKAGVLKGDILLNLIRKMKENFMWVVQEEKTVHLKWNIPLYLYPQAGKRHILTLPD